ncbi:IclR family transcriptional regulator [Neoroseomonas lacus]|uniref:Transcriptional regulator n=1 Tax=Neoroseomonas lacus TaxID=287609 RepID=A0A917NJI3_9PROT|nr:IclR family transcriptional regulator [Neoroseomonas lacus]GGJ02450.1 transcriptional regulator [Neoroseomonas lacus]
MILEQQPPSLKSGVPLVRALDRGLALLAAFSPEQPALTLTDLARAAQLDKGTARRLLQTLQLAGWVRHDAANQRYALTTRVLTMAAAVETGAALRAASGDALHDLARRTGGTAFLWMAEDGMALCLARVIAPQPNVDAVWFSVGARSPMNCGAGPRVLLAGLSPQDRNRALAMPLSVRTPASQTDRAALLRDAETIATRGWDLARDDFVIGLAGLGVPIRAQDGSILGALSLSGMTSMFGDPAAPRHLTQLRSTATEISRQIARG